MSTEPAGDYPEGNGYDGELDPDRAGPGWQPLLGRPGFEQWWDGAEWRGRPQREPEPFSAFGADLARSLRPGPNRAARLARVGIVGTLVSFVLQTVAATGAVIIPRIEPVALTLGTLALAAVVAALTATAAVLGMRASPRLGGRAISTLALGTSLVLGLAPVLLLVAIALSGGI